MTSNSESQKLTKSGVAAFRDRLYRRKQKFISEKAFVFILASIVGVGTGIMAHLLKLAIAHISRFVTLSVGKTVPDWWLLVSPAIGVLIVVALIRYIFKLRLSHGVRIIKSRLKTRTPELPTQLTYSPLLTAALTLGFGGSAGAEGPIAFSGAALGSTVGKVFNLSKPMMMIMFGCGAGAGIAAIFKAPIGGALFTLEVLRMGLGAYGVMVLGVTTLIAGLTATALGGFNLDMVIREVQYYDPHVIPWAIGLGIFCGVYSLYYSYIMKLIEHLLDRMKNPWIKGAVSGTLVGGVVMLIPALYGEGYGVMGHILNGDFSAMAYGMSLNPDDNSSHALLYVALSVVAVKCFVTSLSYNGGGVTGEFAPTLYAGCFAGYLFGAVFNLWFDVHLPVSQMAFFGMAGVMAGAIRAPLMAMFIVVEMSSAYTLLLPVAVVAAISFGIVRLFTNDSFFSYNMDRNNGLVAWIKSMFEFND